MIAVNIQSFSDPDKTYLVRLTDEGWRCECRNFIFNERRIKRCKHIEKAYMKLEMELNN